MKFKALAITKTQAMNIRGGVDLEEYCATNRLIAANNLGAKGVADKYYKEHCADQPKSH